tara:strand:- start:46 stop:537 length:492 start_codon:yes stop_codon:yes gene_type:complete
MLCEMCGAESVNLESRKISGSVLKVCVSCSGMGKKTSYRESIGHRAFVAQTLEKREQKTRYKDISSDGNILVNNFGSKIRKARERKGIDHKTLAFKISEKKSIITSVEAENMRPNEKLIKKLEKYLSIKLTEEIEDSAVLFSSKNKKGMTMGDILDQALKDSK